MSTDSKSHFNKLLEALNDKDILYVQDDNLVRGLDYYNRTVFEYLDNTDNAQNTICAGSRYDYLFESLCGKKLPALGFAIGIERLLEYANFAKSNDEEINFYIIVLDNKDYGCRNNFKDYP